MSDKPQGDDWWLASDGQWYPPQSRSGPAPPPPQDFAPTERWDWRRISNFRGRTRRSEFWAAVGVAIAAATGLRFFDIAVFDATAGLLGIVTAAVWIWLVGGAAVNRMHDMGQSGWLTLLMLIPIVGLGIVIWIGSAPGQPRPNAWGPPVA